MTSVRSRLALVAAVAAPMFAAPAMAADLPQTSAPWGAAPARVASAWQGFYVGVHGGYSWSGYDASLNLPASVFSIEKSSFSGGLFAGMNFQVAPQFVAGVEADFTLWNPGGSALIAGANYRADSDWQGTIRGRIGFNFDNFLIYATGGIAFADVSFSGPGGGSDRTKIGYALGAGVEARVTEQIFARAEYIYTAYGSDDYALGPVQRINGDFDAHTLRVGVGVRF